MPDAVHVLVAEDEPLAATAIEDVLARQGYRVTVARDGLEAVERQRTDPAAVVITDLRMPRMDGRALIRALRRANPGLPLVVMTGCPQPDPDGDDITGARWQPLELLCKPVSPQRILDALRRLLDGGAP
ncbi:response regulator [Azospirillum sp. A39]|uniref:response regulator n=1 Tax=Azospirillum sp. A39 TaxID=3462279 RepID=UPI0040457D76